MCLFGWWDGIFLVGGFVCLFVSILQAESSSAGILLRTGFGWVKMSDLFCSVFSES